MNKWRGIENGKAHVFSSRYDDEYKSCISALLYRQKYGSLGADSATALNNMGCCLYCLRRKGEARMVLDAAWQTFSVTLGHRHPRTVLAFNNCEEVRKSQVLLTNAELNALVKVVWRDIDNPSVGSKLRAKGERWKEEERERKEEEVKREINTYYLCLCLCLLLF